MCRAAAPAKPSRRPGRPRSAQADAAILRATFEMLVEDGVGGMSMEGIAKRAGVAKTTVYRRWASKHEIVIDAVRGLHTTPSAPDTGSVLGDFEALFTSELDALEQVGHFVMPRLLSEAAADPELLRAVQSSLIEPRRASARIVLQRGVERGEIRPDADIELAIDLIAGAYVYRLLVTGGDARAMRERLRPMLEHALAGLAPR